MNDDNYQPYTGPAVLDFTEVLPILRDVKLPYWGYLGIRSAMAQTIGWCSLAS